MLGASPDVDRRRGMRLGRGDDAGVQRVDVWGLYLARWEGDAPEEQSMTQAAAKLEAMAPALAALDRARCKAELYVSTIRDEESGGFSLPARLAAAVGASKLEISISILVRWRGDDMDET